MNWLIIISITFLIALIAAPILWLVLYSDAYARKHNVNRDKIDPLKRIALLKELEMIESLNGKHTKI